MGKFKIKSMLKGFYHGGAQENGKRSKSIIEYQKFQQKKKTKNLLKIVTLSVMIKDESVVKFQIN